MAHKESEITRVTGEEIYLHGTALSSLVPGTSFSELAFLLITGRRPTQAEAIVFDALLSTAIDHGGNAPSAHVARAVADTGSTLAAAVAGGLLTIGKVHGGAAAACAELLQGAVGDTPVERSRFMIDAAGEREGRVPGYGHRLYREVDPRVPLLLECARSQGVYGDHCRTAEAVVDELEKRVGRRLVLNVDGAHAAILSDIGWAPEQCEAVFIIARTAGLCAHALRIRAGGRPLAYLTALQAAAANVGDSRESARTTPPREAE